MTSVHFTAHFEALLQMKAYQEFFFSSLLPLEGDLDAEWGSLMKRYREKAVHYHRVLQDILKEMRLTAQVKKVVIDAEYRVSATDSELLLPDSFNPEIGELMLFLSPESFEKPSTIRHELGHLQDRLSHDFGYEKLRQLYNDAVNEVWNVFIDSRLEREKTPGLTKEERWHHFSLTFPRMPPTQRKAYFETLWSSASYTHEEVIFHGEALKEYTEL